MDVLRQAPRLLVLVLLIIAVSACTPRQSASTVTIGVIAPQSGEFAPLGEAAVNGVQLAVEEINGTTGLRLADRRTRVAVRIADDRGEPVSAEMAVRKFADARVIAILGPVEPDTAAAATTAGIPLIVPSVGDPALTRTGQFVFNFSGVTGTITFEGSQTPRKDVTIIRVKNGAFAFETTVRP